MEEPSGLPKNRTDFGNNGAITEKQDMLQEISQQLLSSKHIMTFGQLMHLTLDLKQYVVFKMSPSSQPTHPQAPPFDVRLLL
jgi:hypothetical protein